jgi:hypothetical protein
LEPLDERVGGRRVRDGGADDLRGERDADAPCLDLRLAEQDKVLPVSARDDASQIELS